MILIIFEFAIYFFLFHLKPSAPFLFFFFLWNFTKETKTVNCTFQVENLLEPSSKEMIKYPHICEIEVSPSLVHLNYSLKSSPYMKKDGGWSSGFKMIITVQDPLPHIKHDPTFIARTLINLTSILKSKNQWPIFSLVQHYLWGVSLTTENIFP